MQVTWRRYKDENKAVQEHVGKINFYPQIYTHICRDGTWKLYNIFVILSYYFFICFINSNTKQNKRLLDKNCVYF